MRGLIQKTQGFWAALWGFGIVLLVTALLLVLNVVSISGSSDFSYLNYVDFLYAGSILFVFGIIGFADVYLELNTGIGWAGWLFWALILFFIIKLKHPNVPDYTELDDRRKIIGYISFFIFIICFSPVPLSIS